MQPCKRFKPLKLFKFLCSPSHLYVDQLAAQALGRLLRDWGGHVQEDIRKHVRKAQGQSGRDSSSSCHSPTQTSGSTTVKIWHYRTFENRTFWLSGIQMSDYLNTEQSIQYLNGVWIPVYSTTGWFSTIQIMDNSSIWIPTVFQHQGTGDRYVHCRSNTALNCISSFNHSTLLK